MARKSPITTRVRLVGTRGQLDEQERLDAAARAAMETFRAHKLDPRDCYEAFERWRAGKGSEGATVSVWRVATSAAIGRVNRGRMSDSAYRLELVSSEDKDNATPSRTA